MTATISSAAEAVAPERETAAGAAAVAEPTRTDQDNGRGRRRAGGYFQAQLRAQARAPKTAVPATIEDLRNTLLRYLGKHEVEAIHRAYRFAEDAHAGQTRLTGHRYITHPLAVASTLAQMRMDHQSIMAALLHDVLEDTGVSKKKLAKMFGTEVANIVDGVSKLATIFETHAEAQAENFQKMAMATARDLRVILVKLADRLHNMRTIGVMRREKRQRIARETLEFYAPIANRLGMNAVRVEFEELAFQALYPLRADRIARAVHSARVGRKALMAELKRSIEASLRREGIDALVVAREKHLYSVYRKMKAQRKPFADIMAVCGFCIVVDQVDTCYRALGVLHNLYKPVPSRFNDYVAIPKANGYQSLHTDLIGMQGVPIEAQIRTREMDSVAENGIAGRWLYRNDEAAPGSHDRARQWVAGLLDLQQRAGNSLEFIENLKIDLFPDSERCCTLSAWRIAERARLDTANSSHAGLGRPSGAVITSTVWPDSKVVDSGAGARSTLQPVQWLPTSVWTA
jgi:guanosine-3',5'-bis(diphosphate) 3'-pyrophosphohydrolase